MYAGGVAKHSPLVCTSRGAYDGPHLALLSNRLLALKEAVKHLELEPEVVFSCRRRGAETLRWSSVSQISPAANAAVSLLSERFGAPGRAQDGKDFLSEYLEKQAVIEHLLHEKQGRLQELKPLPKRLGRRLVDGFRRPVEVVESPKEVPEAGERWLIEA